MQQKQFDCDIQSIKSTDNFVSETSYQKDKTSNIAHDIDITITTNISINTLGADEFQREGEDLSEKNFKRFDKEEHNAVKISFSDKSAS